MVAPLSLEKTKIVSSAMPEFLEERYQPTDLAVHPRDHRRVGGERRAAGHVAPSAEIRLLAAELPRILGQRRLVGGHFERQVRHRRRHVEEERPAGVTADELQLLAGDEVGRVGRAVELNPPASIPEMVWIETVRLALAVVAEELVEAAGDRIGHAPGPAQPPLAEPAGRVAGVVQNRRQRHRAGRHRRLPLGLHLPVAPHHGMARMLARHQHAAARCADGVARPVPREDRAAGEQGVDVGRQDVLAAERGHVAGAQVVAEEEDDVRGPGAGGSR